ncbi:MAG: tandem-95 repeat protein [Shimia sp.]|uniref:Ig-like domain-containing protein n=1 Tax=Shimia sp. TaxID=1954381 RepID=UPI001B2EC31B|nr:Ig-like domain-containing protein [Shimia sp.]MBO6899024.1 tandem-95 repeat protein [Shimia sp.]
MALDFESSASHTITVRATGDLGFTVDQSFRITVNNLSEALVGTDTANTIASGVGGDTVTLNGGPDTLQGTLDNLDGDIVTDFKLEDQIIILQENVQITSISASFGSTFLGLDANGDGIADSTFTLLGDFSTGIFMTAVDGPNTQLTCETFLPALSEGGKIALADINGVANQAFLASDGATTFLVTLNEAQMGASYDNTLGVYEISEDGKISNVRLLAASVKNSSTGVFEISDVAAGMQLGFFIVQDGAQWAKTLEAEDVLGFAGSSVSSAAPTLTVNDVEADVTVFHSFGPDLNPDNLQHVISGVEPGGAGLTLGFEDVVNGGDQDYQDVVFTVTKATPPYPVPSTDSVAISTIALGINTETGEDTPLSIAPDIFGPIASQPYSITLDTVGLSGLASVQPDGTIAYNPAGAFDYLRLGETAKELFAYTVTDAKGGTSQASVEVTVLGLNDAPVVVQETTTGTEDTALRVFPLANDTDAEGDALTIVALRGVSNGTAEIAPDGQSILFTPTSNFDDGVTFEYLVQDARGAATWGSLEVGFTGVNDAPNVSNLLDETEAGLRISFLLGDFEPTLFADGEDLNPFTLPRAYGDPDAYDEHTITLDTTGLLGDVTLGEGGEVSYDPGDAFKALAAGQTALDSFTYTVTDLGGGSSTGTVNITVNGANDAPVASDDVVHGNEDVPLVISPLGNDTDPDAGDSLTIVALRPPENGTAEIAADGLSILFTPIPDWNGTTFLEYQVSDTGGLRDLGKVDINVSPQNDAPVLKALSGNTTETSTIQLTPIFSDVDGDSLTLSFDDTGTQGAVTQIADGSFSYDPNGAFGSLADGATAADTFIFTVSDGNGGVTNATATVTVMGQNVAPVAVADTFFVAEDTPTVLTPLSNDIDRDGDTLVIIGLSNVLNGSAELSADGTSVTFTPDGNYNGPASFTYTLQDPNGETSTAVAGISVTAVNDAPIASGYDVIIGPTNPAPEFVLDLQFTDPDIVYGDTHTITIDYAASDTLYDQNPARFGASEFFIRNATGEVIYSPQDAFETAGAGEVLTETIVVKVTDAGGLSDTAEFNISTTGVNDAPKSFWISGSGGKEDSGPMTLSLGGVIDPDFGDTHQIKSIADPIGGSARLLLDGTIEFTPDPEFWGSASLEVTVEDAAGESVTQTVGILVDGTADPISVGFEASEGPEVDQFYLDVSAIRSLESSGENLRELTLEVVDSNGNLLPNQSAYLSQSSFSPTSWVGDNVAQRVLVTIPDGAPADFGIRANVIAFTPGLYFTSTDPDKFTTATDTFDVSWKGVTNTFEETVTFSDQSIWENGSADTRHEASFGLGATLGAGIDESQTLLYANLTAGGVGAKTHISGAIGVDAFTTFGMTNTVYAEGGGTSGGVTYDGSVSVFHNKVTDQVQFDTSAMLDLANSSFTAGSPELGFSSAVNNLVFNLSAYAKIWGYVHLKTGVTTTGPEFNVGGSQNIGVNLPGFELVSYDGTTLSLLEGVATKDGNNYTKTFTKGTNELGAVTLTAPQVSSTSTPLDAASLASGARTEFANFTLDLDGMIATAAGKPNPVHLRKGIGEEGDAAYALLSLEALDFDLVNRLSYQQNHILTPGETLPGVLVLEDGDRFEFNFGDTIDVGTLSNHDQNGDGQLEYSFELDPTAQFQTKAQIVYEMFDRLEILKASFGGGIDFGVLEEDFSKTLGPWKSTNSNVIDIEEYLPITTQDFALLFDDATTSNFLI